MRWRAAIGSTSFRCKLICDGWAEKVLKTRNESCGSRIIGHYKLLSNFCRNSMDSWEITAFQVSLQVAVNMRRRHSLAAGGRSCTRLQPVFSLGPPPGVRGAQGQMGMGPPLSIVSWHFLHESKRDGCQILSRGIWMPLCFLFAILLEVAKAERQKILKVHLEPVWQTR